MPSKRRPSKREQIPVHLRGKRKIVDPRFNEQFGEYDAKEFRQSYHFITDMRRQELKVSQGKSDRFFIRLFSSLGTEKTIENMRRSNRKNEIKNSY